MNDPVRIKRILNKLEAAWMAVPESNLGRILEDVENTGWDKAVRRYCAPRMSELPDELLEMGLDEWMKSRDITVAGGWKS